MPLEQHEQLRELFNRYLNSQCSPEEVNRLLEYFNIPGNEEALRGLVQEALHQPVNNEQQFMPVLDQTYAQIIQQIHRPARLIPFYKRRFIRIAAAAAVIMVAITIYVLRNGILTGHNEPAYRQLATARGQRLQQKLPDGTMIWLAPGSKLQYPEQFAGPKRTVTLQGEAFFEVAPDAAHPFIVQSANIQTLVLGTSFTMQAYDNDPAAEVTLVTGKVQVKAGDNDHFEELQLTPNQRAVYHKASHKFIKEAYPDAAQMIARREGTLVYKGNPLPKVIRDLELNYNVNIALPAGMQSCTYFGQFNTGTAIAQVLQQIALTYNASIRQKNNQWEIVNGSCNN